jgi:hypothetical protein
MVINYKASGRDLAEPLSSVIARAQRGYDYAQLVTQHKQQVAEQQAQWQQRQQELAQIEAQWKPYHEFATQNPTWAEHVKNTWENRFNVQAAQPTQDFTQQAQQAASNLNLPPEVQAELAEMRQFRSEIMAEREAARVAAQDAALAQEIDTVRKAYPDIDLGLTDPQTGESLEAQILRHANENRIFNFQAAFKDFMFDRLLTREVTKAKETTAKTMMNQRKEGFLASSPQSMLQPNGGQNRGPMSYHQAMELAAREMGL